MTAMALNHPVDCPEETSGSPASSAVVAAVDGSRGSHSAVEWAAREAVSLGLPLRLVNVIGWPYTHAGAGADDALTLSAEVLAEAAARARASTSLAGDVITESIPGPLGPVLTDISRRAHMLVLGHRDDTGFAGMVLSSHSVAVATHASGPVVVVPESPPLEWRSARPRVVVGVDGGPACIPALVFAFEHARRHGFCVEAVVAEPTEPDGGYAVVDALREVSSAVPAVPWRERHMASSAVEALTAAAATDAALLVVGCRSRSDRSSPLLASVSRGAIFLARCPVAVV
jgi:nucleotide-binding universal stress UspA family protein